MNTKKSLTFVVVLLISLLILQISCALPFQSAEPEEEPEQVEEQEPMPDQPEPNNESAEEESQDVEEEPEYLSCPQSGETLTLGFDHALTVNYEGTSLTHILRQGFLYLNAQASEGEGEVAIASSQPISLNYEMMGVMGDCSLEMQGKMLASASGYCEDGTVYLTIIEDWQPANGQMVCPDEIIPFQIPAAGAMIHEGADGNGEIFYLVAGAGGYTSMRPFQEGDGYHTWTLYTTQIDTVPLVPDGE